MSTATTHGQNLLAAIIPARTDLLDKALRHLNAGHFPDRTLADLYRMLERYSEVTGAVLTRDALTDLLAHVHADAGTVAAYTETYDLLAVTTVDDAGFAWALEQLRELSAQRATTDALTQSMAILTHGAHTPDGELLRGHAAARTHALTCFADIDRDLSMQDAPEGDMRAETNDILADYTARKQAHAAGTTLGIEFGIPTLDAKISGLQAGELVLIVGYTSDGKTSLVINLAWHAAVVQHRNVVFLTTETLRRQVRRRLISRHSCAQRFGLPSGLNSRDIKNGTLDSAGEALLHQVVTDFGANPDYGAIYICQVPRAATMASLESKLIRLHRQFPIDLVIMDYLALLRPERRRASDREELGSILKEAKQIATTFNDGAGVPFVSPWQVSRTARENAERTGYYTPSALSETAEASNSADQIISLLAPVDNDRRTARIKAQVMKNRDGERAHGIDIDVDYATCRFAATATTGVDTLFEAGPHLMGALL